MSGQAQRAGGRHRRPVETSEMVAFIRRLFHAGWGDRVGEDPVALVFLRDLQQALTDETNRGIWLANKQNRYSQNEMAAILGCTRQAIQKRIRLGELVAARQLEQAGGGAFIRLADIRGRRAELLEVAELEDRTGSEKERRLRAV